MKDKLSHALLALLLGAGLMLPLLGALGLMTHALMAMALLAAMTAILLAGSVHRIAQAAVAALLAACGGVWLFALGGTAVLTEVFRAAVLHFTGQTAALPLYAGEAAAVLAVLMGLLAWMMTARAAGGYPAMAALLLSALLLWITGRENLLPWLTPAVAAVIALAALANHEEVPLPRVLPLAAAAAVIAMLLTPAGGVSIPPLKEAADNLRQTIYDHLFFTEERSVFSLANEGFYPQGATQLGGSAKPTDHPVMQVITPRKVYLRGAIKNDYTGRMWVNTTGGRRYLWIASRWQNERTSLFDMARPGGRLAETAGLLTEQTVTVQIVSPNTSTLFVPQRIRSLQPGGELVPYFNNSSEVFVTRDLQPGDTYTVSAPLMVSGDVGLTPIIAACEKQDDPAWEGVVALYTQLPGHLQQLLYDLAREVTAGEETPYAQAFALQNYLSRSYRYTLDVAEQPANIDFVTNFLLGEKEGYCTHFASAMTVLCRMVGVPARYVEGYLAVPDETGVAQVTGLHGHAWTEVYFKGFGWLTFDATPSQHDSSAPPQAQNDPPPETEEPDDQPQEEPPVEEQTPTLEPDTPPPDENPNVEPPQMPSMTWLWWLLLLLLIAAAAARIHMTQPMQLARRAKSPEEGFSVWTQAAFDVLLVRRLPREKSESPLAYARRLDALHTLPAQMLPLGRVISMVCYGRIVPTHEEIVLAQHTWQALHNEMPPWKRAVVHVVRAFVPMKYRDFTK